MINLADPGSPEVVTPDDFLQLVIDRRDFHVPTVEVEKNGKKVRVPYVPQPRPWTKTRGFTLHQTACDMGERAERYDTIGAHWSITRAGKIHRHCDDNRIVFHGNGWNDQCTSVEVNGRYAGDEARPLETTWDDPSTAVREQPMAVTPESMLALRMLGRFLFWQISQNGGQLRVLCAHRQSSGSRRNDPGSGIWKEGALPLIAELGLSDGGNGFKIGSGMPIPECWNPAYKGVRY